MASLFMLGPSLDAVYEPFPAEGPVATPGRRQIAFDVPPTSPGGIARLVLLPAESADAVAPIAVHCFFLQPLASIPAPADRNPDWFFARAPGGVEKVTESTGPFSVVVPGVKPSLDPYFVQTILEFQG